jgi:alanyl-tRNA synthetase
VITTNELRERFQAFYEERGHLRVPSHSLIPPADDLSTLFISAGMQQFRPFFLRTKEPPRARVVSVQTCLRAGGKDSDLEEVGRNDRTCSFFEMLGNFSFGDYFKDEAVDFAWDFVTQVMGLAPERLWATVHEGDPVLELDEDAIAIAAWQRVGVPVERIVRLGKDNFWQSGDTGPCGQCSEIFYDRGEAYACGDPRCGPGHCDRYMEIYNLVFMEYELRPGNVLDRLPAQNVDTGLGLERTACVLQGVDSVFDTDGFRVIMDWIEAQSGVAYHENEISQRAHRVLADHSRAATFLIAEGVLPSNEGRGYICRRLLRRAIQQAQRIGLEGVHRLPAVVIEQMGQAYPAIEEHAEEIERTVRDEEERFRETLQRGLKEFEALAGREAIGGQEAFTLATTFGFPIELTQELAEERGQAVDVDRFRELMEGHREISRAGGEKTDLQRAAEFAGAADFETEFVGYAKTDVLTQIGALESLENGSFLCKLRESPFYAESGGQVTDAGELINETTGATATLVAAYKLGDDQALVFAGEGFAAGDRVRAVVPWSVRFPTMANHTATHLLHAALRSVLGEHVRQAGSAVRADKLRFDFTHPHALSEEERDRVERLVNEKVFEAIPVRTFVTPIEEARKLGAMMLFGEKYGDEVRVVEIGDFSSELCGGTHVRSTAEIGPFVILHEGSVGSGARRIEAVSAGEAWSVLEGRSRELDAIRAELEQVRREAKRPRKEQAAASADVQPDVERIGGINVIAQAVEGLSADALLDLSDRFKQQQAPAAVVLGSRENGAVHLVANFDQSVAERLSAGDLVREIAQIVGGGGGGRPTMARAGGKDPERLPDALARARELLASALAG